MFLRRSLLFIAVYILLFNFLCSAQQFIGCAGEGNLSVINISGNTCSSKPLGKCVELKALSLAIYKDSLYSNQFDSLMCSKITSSGAGSCRYVMPVPLFMNALTSDSNGVLYGASFDTLFRINPATRTSTILGRMPFTSAGDLFFFQGKLFLSSDLPMKGIVEVNINNPSQSVMVIPTPTYDIYGLVSVPVDCVNNAVFGLAIVDTTNTAILELNMTTMQVAGIRCTLPYIINDAASITETGVSAGIGVQSIVAYPECTNASRSGSIYINVRGATAGGIYQYILNGNTTNSIGLFDSLSAGTYTIRITATGGCMLDTFATINRANPPTVQVSIISDTCKLAVGQVLASVSGGLSPYTFKLNSVEQPTGLFSSLPAGQYQLKVQDSNRCAVSKIVSVANMEVPRPAISFTTTTPNCYNRNNGAVLINISGSRTPYFTSFAGSVYTQQSLFQNLSSSSFIVKVKDTQGCVVDTIVLVPQYAVSRPLVAVDSASPNCLQPNIGSIQLTVSGNAPIYYTTYLNKRYPANYRFTNLSDGSYSFSVTDSTNCILQSVTVSLKQIIMPGCNLLYVPTAFTPNNDGSNDVFKATGYGKLILYNLFVYDRFGALVFKSSDIGKGWNGSRNGVPQSSGTFVWAIDYQFENQPKQKQKGTVILIR